jgi:hypothetical protein
MVLDATNHFQDSIVTGWRCICFKMKTENKKSNVHLILTVKGDIKLFPPSNKDDDDKLIADIKRQNEEIKMEVFRLKLGKPFRKRCFFRHDSYKMKVFFPSVYNNKYYINIQLTKAGIYRNYIYVFNKDFIFEKILEFGVSI